MTWYKIAYIDSLSEIVTMLCDDSFNLHDTFCLSWLIIQRDTIEYNDSLKHCVTIDTSWVITRNCYNTMYWFVIIWGYKSYLLTHYYIVIQYRFVILSVNLIQYRFMDHCFVMIQISYGDSILYVWYNLTWCLNKL